MEEEKVSKYNKERDTKYRKKVYERIKKTGEIPQWVLNRTKYSKNYHKNSGYKDIQILLEIEEKENLNKILKEKNLTKEQFIENIIDKYSSKQKGE